MKFCKTIFFSFKLTIFITAFTSIVVGMGRRGSKPSLATETSPAHVSVFTFFSAEAQQPNSGLGRPEFRFLQHTQLDSQKPGRTPLNEWSASCRGCHTYWRYIIKNIFIVYINFISRYLQINTFNVQLPYTTQTFLYIAHTVCFPVEYASRPTGLLPAYFSCCLLFEKTYVLLRAIYCYHMLNCAWLQTSAPKQMRTALFWVIMQRVVVIYYRRFRKIHTETSVKNYYYSLRNNPEERSTHTC
jgi:hypothetical protein